ncbi:MAG: hypothetical protein RJB60_1181 [Pseudomonadota bacterium]|jgi:hypothetical protein
MCCERQVGPINQPYVMTLSGHVTVEALQEALWQTALAWPRLRAVLAPTWLSWQLEILPEGPDLRMMVAQALRVIHLPDALSPQEQLAIQLEELNTPLSLQRGLPWRVRFYPHPTQPVLLFNMHHIMGDGASMFLAIQSIMKCLNGQPLVKQALETGSDTVALMPRHWWQWPASLATWWRHLRADQAFRRGREIVGLHHRDSPRSVHSDARHVVLPFSLPEAKRIAKQHQTTINTMIGAILAQAMLKRASGTAGDKAMLDLRVAVNLRRMFPDGKGPQMGNFVGSVGLNVQAQPHLQAQADDMHGQAQEGIRRLEARESAFSYAIQCALPLLGARLLTRLGNNAKGRGKRLAPSFYLSNIGSADSLTPPDARIQVSNIWAISVGMSLLAVVSSMGDRLQLALAWQANEIAGSDVDAYIDEIVRQCEGLRHNAVLPSAAATAAVQTAPSGATH